MKITVNELRNGTTIYRNEQVMQVLEFKCMNEFYHLRVMNYSTHKKEELDIQTNESIETIIPRKFDAELNAIDGDIYCFFDLDTYEIIEVDKSAISNPKWMIESIPCVLYSYNEEVYHVEAERRIHVKVVGIECGIQRVAILENGTRIEVNSRVHVGDTIEIDTFLEEFID